MQPSKKLKVSPEEKTNGKGEEDVTKMEEEGGGEKFLGFEDFSKFYQTLTANLKDTVSSSVKVPIKESDLDFYMTFESFNKFMSTQNDRILKLISNILKSQGIKKSNFHSSKLEDEERMDLLIDSNDQLIEKLGIQLDELQGLRKKTETELKLVGSTLNTTSRNIGTSWNREVGMIAGSKNIQSNIIKTPSSDSKQTPGTNLGTFTKRGAIQKAQIQFKDKADNSSLPFLPKIRQKPNALKPLPEIFKKLDNPKLTIDEDLFKKNPELLENPYTYEIDQFDANTVTSEQEIEKMQPQTPPPLDTTEYKYIDQLEDLVWLCETILGKSNRSQVREIAVDLEHHSYRSFQGFTCLMQISTRTHDFVVDTLKLRSEMYRLNEIFTDWTLTKVFHGSDSDVEWLQKDFGIYVVNMFDTGQAARALNYPHYSLSYLLQKFCQVQAQKHFQQADWRQRPLESAMIRYAREDTHYLLYIYDCMRKELIHSTPNNIESTSASSSLKSNLQIVYDKSKDLCKKVYKKPAFFSRGFMNLCQANAHLNSKQLKALGDLYKWRDRIAREHDESTDYVLKSHQLLRIAELLPREIYGIMALCNPISSIVETCVHEMHEIIKSAREFKETLTALDLSRGEENGEVVKNTSGGGISKDSSSVGGVGNNVFDTIVQTVRYDPESILNCPHDFPHLSRDRDTNEMEIDGNSAASNDIADSTAAATNANSNGVNNLAQAAAALFIKPSRGLYNLPDCFQLTSDKRLGQLFDKNSLPNDSPSSLKKSKIFTKNSTKDTYSFKI